MFKKIAFIFCVYFLFSGPAIAAQLEKISSVHENQTTKLIFKFSDEVPRFSITPEGEGVGIRIIFEDSSFDAQPPLVDPKGLVNRIDLYKSGGDLVIGLSTPKRVSFNHSVSGKDLILSLRPKEEESTFPYELPPTPGDITVPFYKTKYKGQKISLDLQNADVQSVFRLLSEVGGVNIVLGEEIKGKVTLKLKDVPWDQVLDIVMARFGLGKVTLDDVIYIAPIGALQKRAEELKSLKRTLAEGEDLGPLKTEYITVNYVSACDLLKASVSANQALGGQGTTTGASSTALINTLLTKRGSVSCDARTNTLIVKDTESAIQAVKELVAKLDIPTKQVLIEARIVEANTNFTRNLGVQWYGGYYKTNNKTNFRISPSTQLPVGKAGRPSDGIYDTSAPPFGPIVDLGVASTSSLGFALGYITKTSALLLDVHLSAMEQQGLGRIVSAPRIITRDNGEALIRQGYKVPYLELTSEGTATTKFIDADLTLKVVPHILPNNEIRLEINIDKSEPDWAKQVNGVPAILTRTAQTFLRVPNGGTVVIGGLKIAKKQESYDRVPGLSKIPAVGNLFKNSQKNSEEQELVIFITAKVVSSAVEDIDY